MKFSTISAIETQSPTGRGSLGTDDRLLDRQKHGHGKIHKKSIAGEKL